MWYETLLVTFTREQQMALKLMHNLHMVNYKELKPFNHYITDEVACVVYDVQVRKIFSLLLVKVLYSPLTLGKNGEKRHEELHNIGLLRETSDYIEEKGKELDKIIEAGGIGLLNLEPW